MIKLYGIKFFVLLTILVFETCPEPTNLVNLREKRKAIKDALSKKASLRNHRARRYIDASDYMESTYHEIFDSIWDVYPDGHGRYIIPFTISADYESSEKKLIFKTMREIEKNTCIRFRERQNQKDYIVIRNGTGCSSAVGHKEGMSEVFLENDGCIDQATVFHELLHAIGADHEHQRLDRDKYIKVHWENMESKDNDQDFVKDNYAPDEILYDYNSIMHYAEDAFAKEGTITIETFDPSFQHKIGQSEEPSLLDYLKVCAYYECMECMGEYD